MLRILSVKSLFSPVSGVVSVACHEYAGAELIEDEHTNSTTNLYTIGDGSYNTLQGPSDCTSREIGQTCHAGQHIPVPLNVFTMLQLQSPGVPVSKVPTKFLSAYSSLSRTSGCIRQAKGLP